MRQQTLAQLANVPQTYVSRYLRNENIPHDATERINEILSKSKAGLVVTWLSHPGNTITPRQSLDWFGLHSLSQTITKLRKQGHDIRNVGQGGPHDYAVYKLFSKEK